MQLYAETRIELDSEDAIVVVTDGITDPLGTASSPLGQAGLLTELARARPSAESICAALLGRRADRCTTRRSSSCSCHRATAASRRSAPRARASRSRAERGCAAIFQMCSS